MKNTIKHALILFIIFTIPSECFAGLGITLSKHNEEIDNSLKAIIRQYNNKIMQSIKTNDSTYIFELLTDESKKQKGKKDEIEKSIEQLKKIINENDFQVYNEYYWSRKGIGEGRCMIASETDDEFVISLNCDSNHVFVSLLTSSGGFKDYMLGIVYVKIENEWQLYTYRLGLFKIAGKSALEWATEINNLYKKGHLIPAALRLSVIKPCIKPVIFFRYSREQEILDLCKKVQIEASQKFTFPISLSDIKGTPIIHSIQPQFVKMKILPMVWYVTSHSLDDTKSLQNEVDLMTPKIEEMFMGISDEVSHILFKAFTELPTDPQKAYNNYGLGVKVN